MTQALNRLASQGGGPAPASPPAASAPAQPAPATDGRDAKIELARGLMATANGGKYMADFPVLLELFNEVAGKRNIQEFTEPEIDKLIERLRAEGGT